MAKEIYEVIHTSPNINTVYDYLHDTDSPAFGYVNNSEEFLRVVNSSGVTNRDSIQSMYKTIDDKKYIGKPADTLLLKLGTSLAIERERANKAGLLTDGLEVVSYDVNAFKAHALADLESKEGYAVIDEIKPIDGKRALGISKELYPDMSVWIWCRSLASSSNNYEGEIFNLTPFVQAASTSMTKNGGNFSINLPPLTCVRVNDKWSIKKQSLQLYKDQKRGSLQGLGYVAEDSLFTTDSTGKMIRNSFLFHSIINTNDLIFIRFETLKLEGEQRIKDESSLLISKQQLPGRIYDMIGLIDNNSIKVSPSSTDVAIQIGGRDLSKLFIEDGTYFFFLEMSQGMLGSSGTATAKSDLLKRLSVDNGLLYLNGYFNNTIDKVFKFVVNQLSNIKVVPDTLFSAYGDRRNTVYESLQGSDADANSNEELLRLKQDAIVAIEEVRISNGLAKSSTTIESAKVNEIFEAKKKFLKAIRAQKVRRVVNNQTDGWSSFIYNGERVQADAFPVYFNANLYDIYATAVVPQSYKIVNIIDQILDIESGAPMQQPKDFGKTLASGIWQIVKLVFDKAVLQRRIVDSSLSSANGSLINFFRKVCQEPFVEFYSDTYGDTYNLIVRKPPIDRAGILSMLEEQWTTEETGTITPLLITITGDDVLDEQLSFDDSEAYSWYHFQPQAVFQGSSDAFSLSYLPAVFLEEYAAIWGSKPMQIVHNYFPAVLRDTDQKTLAVIEEQSIEDMRFIIESHSYLPFTRKGMIKTNGDRRFKVGNIFRYEPTGEIFFIDGVKQDFSIQEDSIERATILQVSRGMVEQLIYGVPLANAIGGKATDYISYFNIVNTTSDNEYTTSTDYVTEQVKVGEKTVQNPPTVQSLIDKYIANPIASIYNKFSVGGNYLNRNLYLLNTLDSDIKDKFYSLIEHINQLGFTVQVNSARRTSDEQYALWKKNNHNAKPGHSRHETGRAIDINITSSMGDVYGDSTSVGKWMKTGVPQLAESMGFKWGGNAFPTYYDPVHFELNNDNEPSTHVEGIYEEQQKAVQTRILNTSKILSNFKVNKDVLNFFLSRGQFNPEYITANRTVLSKSDKGIEQSLPTVTVTSKRK